MKFRQKEWDSAKSRQIIHTGHISFDEQTVTIAHGTVAASTQRSAYIRSYDEVKSPVNEILKKGDLRNYDVSQFPDLPSLVMKKLNELKDQDLFLYHFFYTKGVKITVGYVISSTDYKLLFAWHNRTEKNRKCLEECISYITPIDV